MGFVLDLGSWNYIVRVTLFESTLLAFFNIYVPRWLKDQRESHRARKIY